MRGRMAQDIDTLGAAGQDRLDRRLPLERDAEVDHLAVELRRHDIAHLARTIEQHIADTRASFDGAAGSIHSYRYLGTHLEETRYITMAMTGRPLMIVKVRTRSAAVRTAGKTPPHCGEYWGG